MLDKIITQSRQFDNERASSPGFMYGYRSDTDNQKVAYSLVNRPLSPTLQSIAAQLATLPPKASVLDLGCGDGVLESHIHERHYSFTALDIEPAAIHTLQKIFEKHNLDGDQTIIGDITELELIPELEKGVFDAVVAWRVTHGISPEYHANIFRQIHRLLKSGSSFFISVASNQDWKAAALGDAYDPGGINDCAGIMFKDYGINRTNPFPVHFFSSAELVKLGEDSGFILKNVKTFQEPSGYTHLQHKMNTYLYAHFIAQ